MATKPLSSAENILQPKRQNILFPSVQHLLKPKHAISQTASITPEGKLKPTLPTISPKLSPASGKHVANINGAGLASKPRTITMDKRNARERNRVKLVNQGFQTLKHHIPDDFRVKKMSKVDTLKCALEYIRFLETTLDEDSDNNDGPSTSTCGFSMTEAEINAHLNKICGGEDSNISSLDHTSSSANSDASPNTSAVLLDESDMKNGNRCHGI